MTRAIRLCVVFSIVSILVGNVGAIYDPSVTTTKPPIRREIVVPWYIKGRHSNAPEDYSQPPKWVGTADPDETQTVETPGQTWSNWRKVTGSEIEQRTEVEAEFGQHTTGPYPTQEDDKSWVREPYDNSKNYESSDPYDAPHEIFDDDANLSDKEKKGYKNPETQITQKPVWGSPPSRYEPSRIGHESGYKKPSTEITQKPVWSQPPTRYEPSQSGHENGYKENINYHHNHQPNHHDTPVPPPNSPEFYEGVPQDSKKPRQEKISIPFHTTHTSTVATYDEHLGVQCPYPHATGQFIYPPDCKFFVNCHQGRANVQPCSPGTHFNPSTLECDFPHKVKCYGGEISDFSSDYDDDRGQREPLRNPPNHQYGHQHHVVTRDETRCRIEPNGYFPHPTDCKKFIQCDHGGSVIKDCGPGTVFNPEIKVCDWPYNVKGCEDALKNNQAPSTDLTPPSPPHSYENYESKPDYSNNWKPMQNAPPPVKKIECPTDYTGLLPHPETCKKFLQCANGITYIMNCGPGTAFNPKISTCDWPYNVPGCSEEKSTYRPTVPPVVTPPWKTPNITFVGEEYETWNGNANGGHGSFGWNHGTNVRPPSGNYDQDPNRYADQGESQTGGRWPSYPGGNGHDNRGTNGQWNPTPSYSPRPFPSLPEGVGRDDSTGQSSQNHGSYSHDHHYDQHHHDGSWDNSGHNHGSEVNKDATYPGRTPPDYNQNGWQPNNHNHGGQVHYPGSPNQNGGWKQDGTMNQGPDPDYPEIDIRAVPDRQGYGRTGVNFSHPGHHVHHSSHGSGGKVYGGWPVGTTPRPSHGGWTNGHQNPTWQPDSQGYDGKMKPSQPEYSGSPHGGFHPSTWRGQDWSESGNHGSKPIPTIPPKHQWNQGDNKSPQDHKLDAWSSRTNVIQHGDTRKQQDTKMDDWSSKTNIFNAQQGNKRTGVKTSTGGPPGIYVTVNGTKGHYITKEIEVNQGHSNTRNYGREPGYVPPKIENPPIGWQLPPKSPIYPSKYEPIGFNSTIHRWKPNKHKTVNKTESAPPIYTKPYYPATKPDYIPEQPVPEPETPHTRFDTPVQQIPNRGPRQDPGIELPTVSIEEDNREETYEPKDGKDNETINFAEVIEPDPDKYDVDVLDDKESWKPRVALENKPKKSKKDSVIMSINKKTTDVEIIDIQLAPWEKDESPFPVHYIAPVVPLGYAPKNTTMTPGSGQVLRLRGGTSQRDGYLEVQGAYPGWGIVCDSKNSWSLKEAHIVCRQLGYTRGAESAWQGRSNWNDAEIPWIATTEVSCLGNETRFQSCKFVHGEQCRVQRDAVGVRCMANYVAHCQKDEVAHLGQCYHLVNPDIDLNHDEAMEYCGSRKAQLLDITTQRENDFLSEWLMKHHPNVASVMTSGIGFTTLNRTIWMWGDTGRAKFRFNKWWPGWIGDKKEQPNTSFKIGCVVMKKVFPCQDRPYANCQADYFFWETENCDTSMKGHSYICKRPYNDISCVYGKGQQYAGNANVSGSGKDCLPWNDHTLAHSIRVNILNPEIREKLMGHNYCRNPNPLKESRPWCYTGSYGEREYCDIPPCGEIGTERHPAGGQCKPKHFECMPGECIPSPWVCDGEEDCTNGRDEMACSSYLGFFTKTKEHKLEGHDVEKWLNTPVKTCALRCKEADFTCRSFSHKTEGNECYLSDTNVGITGDLVDDVEFDYYEMIDRSINCDGMFICGNNKCINQSQVCDGKNDCGDRTDENICSVENLDYNIRLAGSNNSYEGRIEVKIMGHWGQVCDDGFGMIDAGVVCKELGFELGALEVRPGAYYGNLNPPNVFMVDQLKCRGNETSLRECDFDGWGVHNCLPEEAVGIVCKSAVNTCQLGQWKCDTSPTCIPTNFICDEVVDCPDGSDENSAHCDTPFELRLANGSSPLEGRVEVRHHGVWGTVCDDDFSVTAARVICRSLGYGGSAQVKKNGYFGPGEGPIWLDEVSCHGNEAQLYKCEHNQWGRNNCDHDEDAGVICTEGAVGDSELENDTTQIPEISINDLLPSDCGKRPEDFDGGEDEIFAKVVRGSVATKGSYPWQASIRVRGHSKSSHWCGAVVISPLHVLTAAHCLQGYNKGTYFVRAGDYNSDIDEGTEVEANIEDYYIHEDFRKGQRMNNDIALVLLKGRGIPLGEQIMPICLPPANAEYSPGLNCTISGFGSIETGRSAQSLDLRYGWVPLLDQSICRADYVYGDGNISDGMVCAGYLDEGVDSCDGDSGGPLACQNNGAFTLYGVTSWGHHCGRANKPGVYVRVAYYRDWIDKKIRESLYGR